MKKKKKKILPLKNQENTQDAYIKNSCFQAMNIPNYLKKFKIYMRLIENKNTFCLTQVMPKSPLNPCLCRVCKPTIE